MLPLLEYHPRMRYWMGVTATFVAVAVAVPGFGQINGVAPSVTSYGFGSHNFPNAPRASVTSLGPAGFQGPRFGTVPTPQRPVHPGFGHNHGYPFYPYYYSYYPVIDPYVYSGPVDYSGPADNGPAEDESQYQGGPTIFDRRGNGDRYPNDYARRQAPAVEEPPSAPERADGPPATPQPPTVLVFKDGHKVEVGNYAIVGSSLFDLTSGHHQKIALADLDLPATQKANEDQGVDFKLPALPSGS